MYSVSDEFKNAIESTSRLMNCKAYLNDVEISVDKILKLDIEDNINNGDYFTIGEVPAKTLVIELIGVQDVVEGAEIKPYYGVEVDSGKFEYVPCGVYYVDSVTTNKDKVSATCYDKMVRLDDEYTPNIAIPVTLSEIMNDICQQKGIEFEGQLPNIMINNSIKGYSYREMVGFIASFCGGNAKFNRVGKLIIQQYAKTSKIVNPNVCAKFEEKEIYTVSAIACKFGDVANTRGDSSANCVNFTNPFVDDTNIDSIFNLLKGLTFTAASFKYKGDPSVDSGDLITINDIKGNSHVVLVSTQDFKFSGGLTSEIASIGEGKGANAYKQYKFKNKKSITELNVELGKIKGIISEVEEKQEDTYTKTETETLIEAKAGEISLSVAKNEVDNLQIGGRNTFKPSSTPINKLSDNLEIARDIQANGFALHGRDSSDKTVRISEVITSNGYWTISGYMQSNHAAHDITIDICDSEGQIVHLLQNQSTYFALTFYVQNYSPDTYNFVDINGILWASYWFANVKIEKGTKATDYTPDYEEVSESIAKINLKADEIEQSVNSFKEEVVDNFPTKEEMNSAIIQKANEITSTVELTKKVGVELLPQGLKVNSIAGLFATQGMLHVDYWGLYTNQRSWWRSEPIQVDTSQPFYYRFEYENSDGYSPQVHIGFEQWRTPSESMGENDWTYYLVSGVKHTGWQVVEGTLDPGAFDKDTRYLRLRVLVNWDDSPMTRFTIYNMSLKQLRDMNSSTQIAQLADRIETKVERGDVKSIIQQNPEDVRIGFNGITDNVVMHPWGMRTTAPDGSYSEFHSGQMTHYIAGAQYKYHSITWVGEVISYSEWSVIDGYYYVPEMFRNKNFNVIATVSHVSFDRSVDDAYKNLNISVTQIDSANCSYHLHCTPVGVNIGGRYTVNASQLNVIVTVIA